MPGSVAAAVPGADDGEGGDDRVAVPAFAGYTLPDSVGGVVALFGIVLVTSLAAWLTAGQPRLIAGASAAMAGGATPAAPGSSARRAPNPPAGALVALWCGVIACGIGLVVYQLGPLLQQQDQHDLISEYRGTVRRAANEQSGLPGAEEVVKPPEAGMPVGVLEIGALRTQAVVVEGASSSDTRTGPGHVAGTAGLGQPGNSVVVARRNGYGGTFGHLAELTKGKRILVTTTQGQSVYEVQSVRERKVVAGASPDEADSVVAGRCVPGRPLRTYGRRSTDARHVGEPGILEHLPGRRRRGEDGRDALRTHAPGCSQRS